MHGEEALLPLYILRDDCKGRLSFVFVALRQLRVKKFEYTIRKELLSIADTSVVIDLILFLLYITKKGN